MADRFPLILNTSANQIQEIASGDTLDLTGSGITNAGIVTATTFKGNGDFVDIDVDGHTELDNVNVVGVTTFNEDIVFNGANFDFLYDRSLNTLKFDQGIAAFGTSGQMSLQNTTITGITNINAPGLYIKNTSNQQMITCYTGGPIELYHNNSKKFNTTVTGSQITGNLVATGNVTAVDGTFSGNVSIGGTLTYEDVTNIDSIGIITARDGINCTTDGVGNGINIGAGSDLILQHNGTDSFIDNNTGDLYLQTTGSGDDILIESADDIVLKVNGSNNGIYVAGGAQTELYWNAAKRLATSNNGVDIFGGSNYGNLWIYTDDGNKRGGIYADNSELCGLVDDQNHFLAFGAKNGAFYLRYDQSTKLETTTTGVTITGGMTATSTGAGAYQFATSGTPTSFAVTGQAEVTIGGGATKDNALAIESNTTAGLDYDSNIVLARSRGSHTSKGIVQSGDFLGRVGFYGYDGAEYERAAEIAAIIDGTPGTNDMPTRLEFKTTPDGANVPTTKLKIAKTGNIHLPIDNQKLYFGADLDLEILHSGTTGVIDNNTGDLYIKTTGSGDDIIINSADDINLMVQNGEQAIAAYGDGAVELYHDNVKKVETFANGMIVYGPEGGGGLINLYADEGDDNADKWRLHSNPNGSFYLQNYSQGSWHNSISGAGGGDATLYFNNTPKLLTEQGGINVKSPGSDWNNIERTSNGYYGFAFRKEDGSSFNGYLGFTGGGSEINNTSAAQDMVIRSETNIILSKGYSTRLLKTDSNGAVSLYYGNNSKIQTTSTGVAITGIADATGNSARFRTIESGGATVEIRSGGVEGYIGTQTGHKISFITSGNRTMTLLANKSLCIGLKGTTGNTSHNSTIGWEMSDGWTKGVFSGNVGGNTPWTLYNENGAYNRYMGYIKFDGGFANYSSNDINLCDERVKKDFAEVPSQWNNIKNIGFKHFRYQEDSSSEPLKIGVVAQQVETIYPDLVDEDWPQGDANPHTHEKNTGDFYKSVKEEQLLMYSVKALQEAMAKIETLEAEVAALKGS